MLRQIVSGTLESLFLEQMDPMKIINSQQLIVISYKNVKHTKSDGCTRAEYFIMLWQQFITHPGFTFLCPDLRVYTICRSSPLLQAEEIYTIFNDV